MLPDSFAETGRHALRVRAVPPAMYQVIGERGSGTNILRKLIDSNIDIFRTEALGWKHGFPRMLAVPDNLLTVVCIRDARDWALSMHKRPWHAHPLMQHLSFSDFIRATWRARVDRISDFETIHPELDAVGAELQFDRHPLTGRPFSNLFALRRAKLESHLSMLERGGDVAIMRMEAVLADPEAALNWLADRFELKRQGKLKEVRARLGNRFNPSTGPTPRPETPGAMSDRDLEFLRAQLDDALEARLGYVY
ncbi:hypothetical protein OB2597_04248 [Pseudooceanicola batsensis HTCC2597]|uniref:Sulfotransferase domain-containing protein n=1 Tax=Pseudooceanicola batsensis (strain ATCC BAA-863 / DSM 15984 / KCTC 12145 / HTCC2597) TaxID=252305 RepID=A3U2P6_PSEBH|nr:hypothetical protein [Pseudooceanicola batsensis]EAQ01620.1 hypothetical protein OB2597_04248 [Pseudooceanicola batsensis HTCC2597]